jgi:hypothetical protein
MNINKSVFTVSRDKNHLSAVYRDKRHIIGFGDRILAHHVQNNISGTNPKIHVVTPEDSQNFNIEVEILSDTTDNIIDSIARQREDNNTKFVNIVYNEFEIPITLDVDLIIEKTNDFSQSQFKLEELDKDEFLCYPIDKYIGIIIPEELIDETEEALVFRSQIVEPCYVPSYYNVKHLKYIFE